MDLSSSSSSAASVRPLKSNPKHRHLARSAAKRESVQLLGSIKDLQLHFARAGLVEHRPGAGAGVKSLSSVGEDEENVAPRPTTTKERRPWKDVKMDKIDKESARKEARGVVGFVCAVWKFPSGAASPPTGTSPARVKDLDARGILVATAQAIRQVRNLSLSITSSSAGIGSTSRRGSSSLLPARPSAQPKPRPTFSTPSRPGGRTNCMPRAVSLGSESSTVGRKSLFGPSPEADLVGDLRKAGLEVLGALRHLEDRLRIESERVILSPEPYSPLAHTSTGESSFPSDSTAFSDEALVFYPDEDEEEFSVNALAQGHNEEKSAQTWEERLISEGREYRTLDPEDAGSGPVKEGLKRWVGMVERLFFGEDREKEVDPWVAETWQGREQERIHAFLLSHLPLELQTYLPSLSVEDPANSSLISRLSDGYLLTQAYNIAIAQSPRSWGFINDDVYETLGETDEKEWTFRKVANLTCWAAALRLRYSLPVNLPTAHGTPNQRSSSPSPSTSPTKKPVPLPQSSIGSSRKNDPRIDFDPMIIARKGEGWEGMLENAISKWIQSVAREVREDKSRGGFM
ncbi:hypothetical protein P7C73_g725, partial [Tremellales sp. Uapishka_1]